MAEDDFDGWKQLTRLAGDRIQMVGDDVMSHRSGVTDGVLRRIRSALPPPGS